jgi:hypothetical protein
LTPVAAFRAAAASAVASMTADDLAAMQETMALMLTIPEVRAKAIDEFTRTIGVIAEAIARRTDRDPEDFEVRNLAGAVVGVIMAATMPWTGDLPAADMLGRVDAALAHLDAGLPL